LDLTANHSFSDIEGSLAPGKWLAGWRFATPKELRAFFAHYTGSIDGTSSDPALAARMQSDLGGPTDGAYNPKTGFRRASISGFLAESCDMHGMNDGHTFYGYIANDNLFGATIDPKMSGCGSSGAQGASYLVQ
jgi:hypothetical protein